MQAATSLRGRETQSTASIAQEDEQLLAFAAKSDTDVAVVIEIRGRHDHRTKAGRKTELNRRGEQRGEENHATILWIFIAHLPHFEFHRQVENRRQLLREVRLHRPDCSCADE